MSEAIRIKLDENLAQAHKVQVVEAGQDVHDVYDESLVGADDNISWEAVCEEQRLLMTLDLDFSDVRAFQTSAHPGIVLIRSKNPSVESVARILARLLNEQLLDNFRGCLVVADDSKTRIRSVSVRPDEV